jgi:hypothetical protein
LVGFPAGFVLSAGVQLATTGSVDFSTAVSTGIFGMSSALLGASIAVHTGKEVAGALLAGALDVGFTALGALAAPPGPTGVSLDVYLPNAGIIILDSGAVVVVDPVKAQQAGAFSR